jgi:hypothetical protein
LIEGDLKKMKQFVIIAFVLVGSFFVAPAPASAGITFVCHALAPDQCAFSVSQGRGITNFVLNPNQTHILNDSFAGSSYCVVVSRPPAQVKNYPPVCGNTITGGVGTITPNIRAGGTYQ